MTFEKTDNMHIYKLYEISSISEKNNTESF